MASLIEYVRANVDPKAYYSKVFPELIWPASTEGRVECIFHKDKDPSLHFNPETGAWFCHGCDAGGNSIISFHARKNVCQSTLEAATQIYHDMVRPIVHDLTVHKWVNLLSKTPTAMRYLKKDRHLSNEVIVKYRLGWNGYRLMIPIYNEFELPVNAKGYDPIAKLHSKQGKKIPKMVNHRIDGEPRAFGSPAMLYPLDQMALAKKLGYVFVCEGEWDTLALISLGIPAVTTSAGSKSWPKQYNELFRGLKVYIVYDNDKDGMLYDRKVVLKNLRKIAKAVYRVSVPKGVGKDVTDWIVKDVEMRNKKSWLKLRATAKILIENPDDFIEKNETKCVPLDQASQAMWFNRPIRVNALVTGKDSAPYLLPKHFRVTCNQSCDECPMHNADQTFRECKVEPNDPRVLAMLDVTDQAMRKQMSGMVGMNPKPGCEAKIEVLQTFNVEQVLLIPTLDSDPSATSQYVMRQAYYVGHGLHSNRSYQFDGTTLPHPQDQHSTHLFATAVPTQDEIDTFQLTPQIKDSLKAFQADGDIMTRLKSIAEWQSDHVTKIRKREDLHIAVDLVYHSVAKFNFNGEVISRGMLDVLIIGDTRCGKGFVAEGLKRYYGLGEVATGENCTFAGLIGGVQQTARKGFFITWGLIPLNHNRLVVIDEASSISESEIGRMSRVRSEGVAEINKIIRESTHANVRLIWLSNPRTGRRMETYDEGVQAIKELVGANEDISRFDFAVTVATREVPSEIINAVSSGKKNHLDKYPRSLCRALVLWSWSRRPDQIFFSKEAEQEVITQAIKFGSIYSPNIPLVQAENIRVKLAKISAAIAARVFSTDKDGEILLINKEHVECACEFLHMVYSKPSMGYDAFSRRSIANSTIANCSPVDKAFDELGLLRQPTIVGLISLHRITSDTLADYVGDMQMAKSFLGELVRLNCVTRVDASGNWYLKNPAFTTWLKAQRKDIDDQVRQKVNRRRGRD